MIYLSIETAEKFGANNNGGVGYTIFRSLEQLEKRTKDTPVRFGGFVLLLVLRGNVTLSANGQTYSVDAGSAFLCCPDVILYEIRSSEHCDMIMWMTDPTYIKCLSALSMRSWRQQMLMPYCVCGKVSDAEKSHFVNILGLLEDVLNSNKDTVNKGFIDYLILAVTFIIYDICDRNDFRIITNTNNREQYYWDRFTDLIDMRTSFDITNSGVKCGETKLYMTVKEYANLLCTTPNNLSKCVRLFSGKSCEQFINDVSVLEIKKQLLNSDVAVEHIAQFVGFKTPQHLSRFFKRNTGMTPGEFRRFKGLLKVGSINY